MNDEYIRRVEAEEAIEEYCCRMCKECSEAEGGCASHAQHCKHLSGEEILKPVKSADVQPVIHSRWIPMDDGTYNAYCENCGQERGSKSWNKNDFKYCFGCGAKMDGDE